MCPVLKYITSTDLPIFPCVPLNILHNGVFLHHSLYFRISSFELIAFLNRKNGSQYSDSLLAGRSGDRIPVEARFFVPVQTGPGAHPALCTMGTGSLARG
jgi:hypothetical protein